MALGTQNVNSISQFIELTSSENKIRWFRGLGNANYKLIPGLYRHPKTSDLETLVAEEFRLLTRFKQRSVPYIDSSYILRDDFHALMLMQHYGVPTRLLDWTENPFTALFFALSRASYEKQKSGNPKYENNVSIWGLDPILWNEKSLEGTQSPGIISYPHTHLSSYVPTESDSDLMRGSPISIYGVHSSHRMAAQNGAFVIFGADITPMEDIFTRDQYPDDCLIKYVISKKDIYGMMRSLLNSGFGDSKIYPGLSGLGKELKRVAKFWM